ncbi:MAG: AAA family ATPase, partial [Polaromonas sp.]
DVVGIFNTPQDPRFEGQDAPIEYAVRMRRFEEAGRLDRVCARGELRPQHLSSLADMLADFHKAAAVAPAASGFGLPEKIAAPALDNFRDLSDLLPCAGMQARLDVLQAWTGAQLSQLAPLMQARKLAGRVRECHGDLHLANLVLIDQRVRMFDCIEFNEDLRWIDVASEIAFTYVDLLANGQPGLAGWFVNALWSRSGDYEAARLLRFYAVYRAMVRAKVTAIHSAQTHEDHSKTLAYIARAEDLMVPPPVRLVITHGLSGCGKTVASSALLQGDAQACTLRLRSDMERKRLFGLTGTARSGSAFNAGIYTPQARIRTYARLHELADMLLRAGWSVIVDAAFLKKAERDEFRMLAQNAGAAFGILAPQATPGQLRERIEARNALGQDASEATLDVLAQQMQTLEPLDAKEMEFVLGNP